MSAKLKTGLSSYNVSIDKGEKKPNFFGLSFQVGKVYGVVTTKNTPTPEKFKEVGGYGGIGTVFFRNYNVSKDVFEEVDNLPFSQAIPLFSQLQYFPLIGELIYIVEGPSPPTQINPTSGQKYYIPLNLWNNTQQNSQPANDNASLGLTFISNPNIRPLLSFEGDVIIKGRQGSALRFSSTTKTFNNINQWSTIGNDDSPITILSNGFAYQKDEAYHIENINKDLSSVYLTSTQKLPLETDKKGVLNNLTNPLNSSDYFGAQVVVNSDRVTLNSKKDEVLIFAKTNVEINTKNVINLNADGRVHLNSNVVFLGLYDSKSVPQPVLLGNETVKLLLQINNTLNRLAGYLSSTVSTAEGTPIVSLRAAGADLSGDIKQINKLLKNILSKNVFTS